MGPGRGFRQVPGHLTRLPRIHRLEIFFTDPGLGLMTSPELSQLSRRERQIMNALYAMEEAGAADVARHLDDQESYDSIRVIMGILEKKGFLKHRRDGKRYVYRPTIPAERARRRAMEQLTDVFFKGSESNAILAFLDMSSERLTEDDFDEIEAFLERASARKRDT